MARSSPLWAAIRHFSALRSGAWAALVCSLCLLVFVRSAISANSYSGQGKPPMYGDYEAQRHWMEITTALPPSQWYFETADNPLQYWGLDYPPLTAYHSWLMGKIFAFFEPAMVALNTSRGYESASSKLLMRLSVLAGDVIIFFPAVWYFVAHAYYGDRPFDQKLFAFTVIGLSPALLLIDHGHFQYNSISLGLAIFGAAFIINGHDLVGSVFFTLSLCFKQMSLYLAPAFFFYLLGKTWRSSPSFGVFLFRIILIGAVVLATLALNFLPFLSSPASVLQVFHRMFPTARGLFEDKVANMWCSVSPVLKLKRLLSPSALLGLCTATTLLGFLPSNFLLLGRPTPRNFLLALATSALSFFMFSYQVHEKSFLLPLTPITLLLLDLPGFAIHANVIAAFSMFPLLQKDGLSLPYLLLLVLWLLCTLPSPVTTAALTTPLLWASIIGAIAIHGVMIFAQPPAALPDLFTLALCAYSFAHFLLYFLLLHLEMLRGAASAAKKAN